jgi:cysteinyl-tRNA synthetase
MSQLQMFNSRSREKETFKPINPEHIGMYVCGPTVYGDPHLGHARSNVSFDIVFRYLQYLGYKVRYVRNITDVGHLESDADEGEDKVAKKARVEKLEPMEIVQRYTIEYHDRMRELNSLPPSIEPSASGHIIEQINIVKKILDNGYAYESNGSVYFDVQKYAKDFKYGELSGKKLEDMLEGSRELEGQAEKHSSVDFAIWKKAKPEHIMQWDSPWGKGFPGWHLECTAMSTKYLGNHFDIHCGGMDLQFPHHEAEIAQNNGSYGEEPCNYWLHNNMLTIEGKKMGKSLGNFITLKELFDGDHKLLEQSYHPMTVRFFMLQAHYRSTLDFSNEALQAAEKGFSRLMKAYSILEKTEPGKESKSDLNFEKFKENCLSALNDDFNTPVLIAHLFEAVKHINALDQGRATLNEEDLNQFRTFIGDMLFTVLGLKRIDTGNNDSSDLVDGLMELIIDLRTRAKQAKDYNTADAIRDRLNEMNVQLKDSKEGTSWEVS